MGSVPSLDYSIHNETDYKNLEIKAEEKLEDALNMIQENQFSGFDKYFTIEDFNPEIQAFAPRELLTEEEKLPDNLHTWLESHPAAVSLFVNLRREQDEHIALRKAILNDENNSVSLPGFTKREELTEWTIQWLLDKNIEYVHENPAYDLIFKVIEKLPEDYVPMIFLKYTGRVVPVENKTYPSSPVFILEEYQENSWFLSTYSWTPTFREMLNTNKALQEFIANHTIYAYKLTDLLSNHRLNKVPKIEISTRANEGNYKELVSPVYEQWKQMPESKKIRIKTSDKPIGISFMLHIAGKQVFSVGLDNLSLVSQLKWWW